MAPPATPNPARPTPSNKSLNTFEVVVDGSPVWEGSISSRFAGRLMGRLQDVVAAVAQSIAGRATRRGVIGREILEQAELRLAATSLGSFRLIFARPEPPVAQLPLDLEDGSASLFDDAIQRLMDVIEAAERDDHVTEIANSSRELGGRALSHIEELARTLTGAGATALFVHRMDGSTVPRVSAITAPAAQHLEEVLSTVREQQRTIRVSGRLIGASWASNSFDLQTEGPGEKTYSGKVSEELRAVVDENFDQVVTAVLSVRTIRNEVAGEETEQVELIDLD